MGLTSALGWVARTVLISGSSTGLIRPPRGTLLPHCTRVLRQKFHWLSLLVCRRACSELSEVDGHRVAVHHTGCLRHIPLLVMPCSPGGTVPLPRWPIPPPPVGDSPATRLLRPAKATPRLA